MSEVLTVPPALASDEIRVDGRAKVSGQAKYTADFTREGMLWADFVTSPYAHARIVRIDASAARAMHGVRAVIAGADVGARYFGCTLKDWPVLALERVNFIGEYVVAVAADTRAIAEAAAAAVVVEYEELPAVFDPDASIRTMRACACGDATKAAHSIPSRAKSAVYFARPETFSRPSMRNSSLARAGGTVRTSLTARCARTPRAPGGRSRWRTR